jgi:hypothetical protein
VSQGPRQTPFSDGGSLAGSLSHVGGEMCFCGHISQVEPAGRAHGLKAGVERSHQALLQNTGSMTGQMVVSFVNEEGMCKVGVLKLIPHEPSRESSPFTVKHEREQQSLLQDHRGEHASLMGEPRNHQSHPCLLTVTAFSEIISLYII